MSRIITTISDRRKIAKDTYEVTFKCVEGEFHFTPGQYVEVILPDLLQADTKGSSRFFSITSKPDDNQNISVAFRMSDSNFKKTLVDKELGSQVMLRGPFGDFSLPNDDTKIPVVLLAGGIGIAPFLSMIRCAVERLPEQSITLIYANSKVERAVYVDELKALSDKYQNFTLILKYGYIDPSFVKRSVNNQQNCLWFICGTPMFVHNAKYILGELTVDHKQIKYHIQAGYGERHLQIDSREISHKYFNSKEIESYFLNGVNVSSNPLLEVLSQSVLISVSDPNGIILYVNDYVLNITQYRREDLVGKNYNILNSGYHPPDFFQTMWETIKSGRSWRGEVRNVAKDGSFFWVDTIISPIFDDDGQIKYYLTIRFTITDEKRAEEELHQKTEMLQTTLEQMRVREVELEKIKKATLNILEDLDEEKRVVEKKVEQRTLELQFEKAKILQVTSNMKAGAILLDGEGKVEFVNRRVYEILKVSPAEAPLDRIVSMLCEHFDEKDRVCANVERMLKGESFMEPELTSGSRIYEVYFQFLEEQNAAIPTADRFILVYDVTETKLLERSKSELVAIASHQLRTPLTAMRGNVELLMDESYGPLNVDQKELLSDMDISTNRLISMVNDMLDITKIEKGTLDMDPEDVVLKEVIDSICEDFSDYARRREVVVSINVPKNISVFVDRSRVRQVLQNLIDNAIKYGGRPGKLEIEAMLDGDYALVTVKDNGIGIPKTEHSRIFGRFYRASNTSNSSSSGSGLGLYIVRSIVEQLGGKIWFESDEGEGTKFSINLPTKKIAEPG